MNESLILQSALIGNILAVIGSLVVATKYYFASRELHQALHKQSEQDGLRYAQSFQTQLWQERKDTLERELAAYKKSHEQTYTQLVQLQERFSGLEQAYHEAREEVNASVNLVNQAQTEENKKRKGKK